MSNGGADEEPLFTPPNDELQFFRTSLRWMCMDHSNCCHALLSLFLFLLLAVVAPVVSMYNSRGLPVAPLVQASLIMSANFSFVFLSYNTKLYGLRGCLFLDELHDVSDRVRIRYTDAINRSFLVRALLVAACFAAEVAYKICWYRFGAGQIPSLAKPVLSGAVACLLELASWIYSTAIYLLACDLFCLICHLQTLRLQDLAAVFPEKSEEREVLQEHRFPKELEVRAVLQEHRRVRKLVEKIGYRSFMLIPGLIQLVCVLLGATAMLPKGAKVEINLLNNGELVICTFVIVTGLWRCLSSARDIIFASQALASRAAKWHAHATVEASAADPRTPYEVTTNADHVFPVQDEEGEPQVVRPDDSIISFQKRQALVMYLKHHADDIKVPIKAPPVMDMYLSQTVIRRFIALAITLFLGLLGETTGISLLDLLKL